MTGKYHLSLYLFKFLVISLRETSRIYEPTGMSIFKAVVTFGPITVFQ